MKSLKDSFLGSGRLDAEYYQPKYEEVEQLIKNTKAFNTLGNITTFIQRGKQPKYNTEGLTVINSRHVRQDKIIVDNNRKAAVQHNSIIIHKNDLLINGTGVGTIGRSAVYLYDFDALPDNHVTVLRTTNVDTVFLSLFLNSIAGQLQVDKYFKGSSGQIELYSDDIKKFVVWIAPKEFQLSIREQIEQSHKLKNQSKQLLHIAKTGVEKAIESSEVEAMAWMEAEIHSLSSR